MMSRERVAAFTLALAVAAAPTVIPVGAAARATAGGEGPVVTGLTPLPGIPAEATH